MEREEIKSLPSSLSTWKESKKRSESRSEAPKEWSWNNEIEHATNKPAKTSEIIGDLESE